MADPARGAVRASRVETFHRILRLEEERGYGDRAVMGGLDRFLAAWRQELEREPQGALLDHLTRLGVFQGSYATRTVEERGAWAGRVLKDLTSAPDVSPKAKAPAYRPRKPRPAPSGHSLDRPASVLPGVGPTIASIATCEAWDVLAAPVLTVSAKPVPAPYSERLESQVYPTEESVEVAVRQVVDWAED